MVVVVIKIVRGVKEKRDFDKLPLLSFLVVCRVLEYSSTHITRRDTYCYVV